MKQWQLVISSVMIWLSIATYGHGQMIPGTVNAKQSGAWSVTVTQGTGTNLHVVCDSGCGGAAAFNDNAAFTFGTTAVNNMGAVVDDVATNTVTENSAGAPRMSTNRILYGNLRTAAGVELLGQTTLSGSIPVAIASNQTAIPASQSGAWSVTADRTTVSSANNDGACISVTGSTTSILASFSTRRAAFLKADPGNTQRVFIKLGTTATTSDFPLDAGDAVNIGNGVAAYTGAIDGISASGTQSICVLEF